MELLIIINIIILIYVYFKYYKVPKDNDLRDENVKDKESIIIGYINDQGVSNNFDLIIAQIIELNRKGYLFIEYDNNDLDKYNYVIRQNTESDLSKLKEYEIIVLRFLFPKNAEITKRQLEAKLNNSFDSYNIQFKELNDILNKEVIYRGIIDKSKQKRLAHESGKYAKYACITIFIVAILGFMGILNFTALYMSMYVLEKIVTYILISKSSIFTPYGQRIKYNIDSYRIDMENKEFLNSKNTKMEEIVKDKEFADSIALHIDTQAKDAFIKDELKSYSAKESKKIIINIVLVSSIIILLGIILFNLTMILTVQGFFWVYLIFAIICATVFDIAHSLSAKKIKNKI